MSLTLVLKSWTDGEKFLLLSHHGGFCRNLDAIIEKEKFKTYPFSSFFFFSENLLTFPVVYHKTKISLARCILSFESHKHWFLWPVPSRQLKWFKLRAAVNVICALPCKGNTIVHSLKRGGEIGQYLVVPMVPLPRPLVLRKSTSWNTKTSELSLQISMGI